MPEKPHIHILGGGFAGLAAGHYARKHGLPCTLFEAGSSLGGNAITLEHNGFLFDSGAHRFHDKEPRITREVQDLLGPDLQAIQVSSHIVHQGRLIDFPLSPLNLLKTMGPAFCLRAGLGMLKKRLGPASNVETFADFARQNYGPVIAEHFLLNYSRKLWGRPPENLSPQVAGRRLEGLTLKSFLQEAFRGSRAKTEHLDGAFFYPTRGIGMLTRRLQESCGPSNIMTNTPVTGLDHNGTRITGITVNHGERFPTDEVMSTIPLNSMLEMMHPQPPEEVLAAARGLVFRNVILVALFLGMKRVSRSATLYFPDSETLFTRVYEPKNRSWAMAPEGKTSLVTEIPCQEGDSIWTWPEKRLADQVKNELTRTGLVAPGTLIEAMVHRMPNAYPILEAGYTARLKTIADYLQAFSNLHFSGRNGLFAYLHLHDLLLNAERLILQCREADQA